MMLLMMGMETFFFAHGVSQKLTEEKALSVGETETRKT